MCCETHHGYGAEWHHGCFCCCCLPRRFFTKKEQLERLQEYASALEQELAGVKEYIKELKKGGE